MINEKQKIIVFDNGGKTCDRFTGIIFSTGEILGFNERPFHPTFGFGQYCGNVTDRMNITYGAMWRNRFDEKKILKIELKNYLREARNNPTWLGMEIEISKLSTDAQRYLQQILAD